MSFDKTHLATLSEAEGKAVKRLFEKGVSIPPQPQILQDLYKKLMAGEADVRVYARVLAKDPGLVAMLFKLVQNAAYRRYQPFESVEHILQAIGLQQSPSNQSLVGMALFMSFFIMSPVLDRINSDALQPYMSEQITAKEALEKAEAPLRQFMLGQTRIKDLDVFSEIANVKADKPEDVPLRVLIPAFITSELKTAFQIGFMLFLPFLVIDLVIASVLMAMGMMMLSPMIISLPFKLMLFVLVDGWGLIMGSLANSFGLGGG